MTDGRRTVPAPATVLASGVLGLVFLWRLPALTQAAGYLALVGAGVGVVAVAAAVRILAGRPGGRVLAAGAAVVAFGGQALNAVVGLPAGEQLRGDVGWAGVVVLVCSVVIGVLGVRDLRRAVPQRRGR
jgi:hypothetical protein